MATTPLPRTTDEGQEKPANPATNLDQEIATLVDHIRDRQNTVAENEASIYEFKEALAALLEARGANWKDESGYARLISEGRRITYDTSRLDDLIIRDPLHYGWLKDYRVESRVSPSVQVK